MCHMVRLHAQIVGVVHMVPVSDMNMDHDNHVLAKKALDRKSKGVHKPRVEVNVEGAALVCRDETKPDTVRDIMRAFQ